MLDLVQKKVPIQQKFVDVPQLDLVEKIVRHFDKEGVVAFQESDDFINKEELLAVLVKNETERPVLSPAIGKIAKLKEMEKTAAVWYSMLMSGRITNEDFCALMISASDEYLQ